MCWRLEFRERSGEIQERYRDIHDIWTCVYSNESPPGETYWQPVKEYRISKQLDRLKAEMQTNSN